MSESWSGNWDGSGPSGSVMLPTPVRYGLTIAEPPLAEPVSLEQARRHLRIDHVLEDDDIVDLVTAARQHIELICNCAIVTQTLVATYDRFPAVIRLPRAPLISVTTVKYTPTTGAIVTLAADQYQVDISRQPGRIAVAPDVVWPDSRLDTFGAVEITYVAGYGATDVTPRPLCQAIKLLVGHWYEHREAVGVGNWNELPLGVRALLSPYWLGWLA